MSDNPVENLEILIATRRMFASGEAARLRRAAGVSHREAANAAGISASQLVRYENGVTKPLEKQVKRLWPMLKTLKWAAEHPGEYAVSNYAAAPTEVVRALPEPKDHSGATVAAHEWVPMREWLRQNGSILWGEPLAPEPPQPLTIDVLRRRAEIERFLEENPEMVEVLREDPLALIGASNR
jgi:transcriptional regulator with XRE-family HTH domain